MRFLVAVAWLGWLSLLPGCSSSPTGFPVAHVDRTLSTLMRERHVPGVQVCVFSQQHIIYSRALGIADQRDSSEVNEQTLFEAASLSKPVFAYLLQQLQAEGRLPDTLLSTPLGAWMPWGESYAPALEPRYRGLAEYSRFTPQYDSLRFAQLTPADLLTHRSGMGDWWDTLPRILFPAGERFSYSDDGYVLLQRLVEHHTQQPLQALLDQHLPGACAPMRLFSPGRAQRPVASGHRPDGGFQREIWRSQEALAHGSLYSSAQDYAAFMQHLDREKAFPDPSEHIAISDTLAWGLGWGLEMTPTDTIYWHHGNDTYFQHFCLYSPYQDRGLVIMTNSRNGLDLIHASMPTLWGYALAATRWAQP